MGLTRGAVVIASLRDPSGKPRPFLVLRSDHFADNKLVTLLAITATLIDAPPLRVPLQPTAENGLREVSQVMIDHIQSLRVEGVRQMIGRITGAELRAVERAVAVYLGFAGAAGRTA